MCGIVGQISFDGNSNNYFVKNATESLIHRGKDSTGLWHDNFVSIGHNLLSITGEKTQQPVFNKVKTVFAAVNGEFYDYEKIVKELNIELHTHSDSELIIHLYEKGLLFKYLETGKLNGEFAFFIYDKNKNKVLLGRDSFGVKPLYIYRNNENVYISSEIKSYLVLHKLNFDINSLNSVFTMQYHDTYNTLFEDVKQIQPGTVLSIDVRKRIFSEYVYFNMSFEENYNSIEDNKIILLDKLNNSVSRRIRNKKKTGIALSGGIDSASVLALSSQYTSELNAYTISFRDGQDFDEYNSAKEMADMYEANFNAIEVDEKLLLDNLEKSIFHSEQVSINMHVASKYLLFKKMSEDGCKISLSGEGSDEILFGYPHLKMDINYEEHVEKNRYLSGMQTPDKDSLDTSIIEKHLGYVPTFLKAKYSMGYKIKNHILRNDFVNKFINHDPASYLIRIYEMQKEKKPVFNSTFLWTKVCLSNYILNALGDKLEMASTIEGRVPFLDREFFDFVKTIPLDQKIFNGNEKFILKEAMKPYISSTIYNKQKHPFIAPPLFKWSNNNHVYEHIMDIIHSSSIVNSEFFDQSKMLNMINLLKSGNLNANSYDPVIMMIFSIYYLDKNYCK